MQITQFPDDAEGQPLLKQFGSSDRARLSGPGLRTFRNIANLWDLSETQRRAALGYPPRSTYHAWLRKAVNRDSLSLPFDTLLRISAILGICKALSVLFHNQGQAQQWLKGVHKGTVFSGAAPLDFIIDGGQDGMMTVRRYLDGWRGGAIGHGAAEGSFETVTEDDVVFL